MHGLWISCCQLNMVTYPVVSDAKIAADEVQKHLDLGKKLLSEGDLNGALTHYHSAVGKLYPVFCLRHGRLRITKAARFHECILLVGQVHVELRK